MMFAHAVRAEVAATFAASRAVVDSFVNSVAGVTGVRLDDVRESLASLPANLRSMLDSPEGWTALAEYIAADLRTQCGPVATVH